MKSIIQTGVVCLMIGLGASIALAAEDPKNVTVEEIKTVLDKAGVDHAVGLYVGMKSGLAPGAKADILPFLQAAADVFKSGRRDLAVELLEKIKTVSPSETAIYRVLGQLYWYMERRDDCVSNFKTCLERDKNDATARRYWDLLFFVPEQFQVPASFETEHLHLRFLRAADVDLDYRAVMGSRAHLRGTFGPDDDWPADDLSREEDLRALQKHERETLQRQAFTYTVMNPEGNACLGCVYILPAHTVLYDAAAYLWVTREAFDKGYDRELFEGVKAWLGKEWPFSTVAFPGREIDWAVWEKIQY